MSQLTAALSRAATRNHELLSILAETEYAQPALEQSVARKLVLESRSTDACIELKKLHSITEDERKDHVRYRDSIVKCFVHNLGGQKGKEKYASKEEKEEREFLEAWQKERDAMERREQIDRELEYVYANERKLESDKAKHDQAQTELDELYDSIFAGPTPQVPAEDRMEAEVASTRDIFRQVQTQQGNDEHASNALLLASQALERASSFTLKALDYLDRGFLSRCMQPSVDEIKDGWTLFGAKTNIDEYRRQMREAVQAQPAIALLANTKIDCIRVLERLLFGSSLPAQRNAIITFQRQIGFVREQVKTQRLQQHQRTEDSKAQVKQASQALASVREELQQFRAATFDRFVEDDDAPPPYHVLEGNTS